MTKASPRELVDRALYVDRAFVSDLYEVITGESPKTTITRNQGKKAGAAIPIFSAEVSAQETRSYPVSTFSMLSSLLPVLELEPTLQVDLFEPGMESKLGWIKGELTVFKARGTVQERTGKTRVLAEGDFFHVRQRLGVDIALITTPEYFSHSIDTFLKLQHTILSELSIPVHALLRVFAARSHHRQWIAVPLVLLEQRSGT